MAMEQAEQTPNPEARQFLQTVVIFGAGPTGCEMAGAVSELMRPGEVVISNPDGDVRVQAATVIWTAGVKPSHLGQKLTEATG